MLVAELRDTALDHAEPLTRVKVRDVFRRAGRVIVHANNGFEVGEQSLAQMRSQESRASGHQGRRADALRRAISVAVMHCSYLVGFFPSGAAIAGGTARMTRVD